jgi:UDP-N-acetylmuramate: L-alanyl-gamma-D-glutamyl-meso-diaminopimelate ligase
MNVHFIAIGGSAMHSLAVALHQKGYTVSGSDDEIFEPSKSRLESCGILPPATGWFPAKISTKLDAVILGMHAKADNPELLEAMRLGLKIYSYPEFLYEQSKNKKRVVIAGSHGKTTITAMIMHVLKQNNFDFDYMVGAPVRGFGVMVRITAGADIMVFEGDEYLTSPIDPRPKFHLYKPHIALISGIAWDHINVFPTYDIYQEQFSKFIGMIIPDGVLVYCSEDQELESMIKEKAAGLRCIPYKTCLYVIKENRCYLSLGGSEMPLNIFGQHNMQNLAGALAVCRELGVADDSFYKAIQGFQGAAKRLQLLKEKGDSAVYLDFAHAPSKLTATVKAVKQHNPERKLVACMELHTYSSLNVAFLQQYRGAMEQADLAVVYYNPHTLALKRLPEITPEDVKNAFGHGNMMVFNDSSEMLRFLLSNGWEGSNLLLMSSGNFDGLDPVSIADSILGEQM